MGKNGERRIGNFPHFSPLKKTSKDVQFSLKDGEKWGKMGETGERILWGKHFTIGKFPHWLPPGKSAISTILTLNFVYCDLIIIPFTKIFDHYFIT